MKLLHRYYYEFKEIRTYFTILNAISFGNTKPVEIANFAGIKHREIYPYLENLIRFGFVKKETSFLGKRKEGIYLIKDLMLDFWFNFVYKNREEIENNHFKVNNNILNSQFGKRFEILVREEIIHKLLPTHTKIGKWLYKDKEIDFIAVNEETKEMFFGECKWSNLNYQETKKILTELKEKATYVNCERKKDNFCIVAKKINEKARLKKEGYFIFDIEDFKD